jgi:hypothetical protein
MGGDATNMHYWEYNSTNASDGKPVDVSQRKPESRQLTMPKDAEIIANYSNPSNVLDGWAPAMAPVLLTPPAAATTASGGSVTLVVKFAAIPLAALQWSKNGTNIPGATNATLNLINVRNADAGSYSVTAVNASGRTTSNPAVVTVR